MPDYFFWQRPGEQGSWYYQPGSKKIYLSNDYENGDVICVSYAYYAAALSESEQENIALELDENVAGPDTASSGRAGNIGTSQAWTDYSSGPWDDTSSSRFGPGLSDDSEGALLLWDWWSVGVNDLPQVEYSSVSQSYWWSYPWSEITDGQFSRTADLRRSTEGQAFYLPSISINSGVLEFRVGTESDVTSANPPVSLDFPVDDGPVFIQISAVFSNVGPPDDDYAFDTVNVTVTVDGSSQVSGPITLPNGDKFREYLYAGFSASQPVDKIHGAALDSFRMSWSVADE